MKRKLTALLLTALLFTGPVIQLNDSIYDVDIGTENSLIIGIVDDDSVSLVEKEELDQLWEPQQEELIVDFALSLKTTPPSICKIENKEYFGFGRGNIGFPTPSYAIPNEGIVKIGVVYLDFVDYRWSRTESTYELTEFIIEPLQDYFNTMSDNRIQFDWHVSENILSLSKRAAEYDLTRHYNPRAFNIKEEILATLSSVIDYESYDIIFFAINPDISQKYGLVSVMSRLGRRGSEFYVAFVGPDTRYNENGYLMIAHEIGHMFGLPDLYTDVCSNTTGCEDGSIDWREQFQHAGAWSMMSFANHPNNELLGWERWLLGWVDDEEIHCLQNIDGAIIQIHTAFSKNNGTKMIIVNLESYINVVIEMKDHNLYCQRCTKGLLIYTVDTTLGGKEGPIKVLRPSHSNDIVKEDVLLFFKEGYDTLFTNQIVIQIIAENDMGFIVSINSVVQ
jgi:M6 family metalloprotease-like protein